MTLPSALHRHVAIAAADLRPGNVVCDDRGVRLFAAFDRSVQHDDQGIPVSVTVWTGMADQPRVLPVLEFPADEPLLITLEETHDV